MADLNPNEPVQCPLPNCGWSGTRGQTMATPLPGNTGINHRCPRCGISVVAKGSLHGTIADAPPDAPPAVAGGLVRDDAPEPPPNHSKDPPPGTADRVRLDEALTPDPKTIKVLGKKDGRASLAVGQVPGRYVFLFTAEHTALLDPLAARQLMAELGAAADAVEKGG